MVITTSKALIMTLILLFVGFIWASFFKEAPYATFAGTAGLVFGGYAGKRLAQKGQWTKSLK